MARFLFLSALCHSAFQGNDDARVERVAAEVGAVDCQAPGSVSLTSSRSSSVPVSAAVGSGTSSR